ncbi:MAG: HAMP domain-containing sensor histidine kinase [Patescibacteria group bacterium]|jgi:signal transduction histidine kinase
MKINKIFKDIFDQASLRLSLFYVLIIMMISIGFSVGLFNISSNEIGRGLGKQSRFLQDINMHVLAPNIDLERLRQEQIDESNGNLRTNLIYFNLLILLLSSCASYFFARKTLEPIRESVEAQNRFTADASHELRTPLTALRTEIEVAMRDDKLNLQAAKKLLESNLEEIAKLESLSNALLKLAKNENSKPEIGKVDLSEVVISAYEKVESLANKKSMIFDNHLQPAIVRGDRHSLTELFVILLDNAIKYSPNKSKINIDIQIDGNFVLVGIKDRGLGIKASDLPYIFNRFYRADNSRSKESVAGYGLGLSIAKQIADLHGGNLSATSKPGKGSEFIVKLPA